MVNPYSVNLLSMKHILISSIFFLCSTSIWALDNPINNSTSISEPSDFQLCLGLPDQERLDCYDRIASAIPPTGIQNPEQSAWDHFVETHTYSAQTASDLVENITVDERQAPPSYLENMWSLRSDVERPLFALRPYASSYFLFAQYADHVNRQPTSPSPGRQYSDYTDYKQTEAKFQLSFKSKLGHDFFIENDSLWFGYTQVSQWQIWSPHISRPFRATSYKPEFIYVMPVQLDIPNTQWTWRMATLGLIHESNGQSKPLSRSWNRVYVGLGFDHPNFSLYMRAWSRFSEGTMEDDNPRITTYMGRADLQLTWEPGGGNTIGMRIASNLKDANHGSIQLDYYFPISRFWGMGDHLRGYIQAFHGYGETITDYNFRRTTFGIGLALREW